jgi:hypothetical protein
MRQLAQSEIFSLKTRNMSTIQVVPMNSSTREI